MSVLVWIFWIVGAMISLTGIVFLVLGGYEGLWIIAGGLCVVGIGIIIDLIVDLPKKIEKILKNDPPSTEDKK